MLENENISYKPGAYKGKAVAILTSGGDSQGMNAALRGLLRVSMYFGLEVYFVKEGYRGLIDGGHNIIHAEWSLVFNIIQIGGTVIGSDRCFEFMEYSGRLKAAYSLVSRGITNLVVVGGDGSLTGASLFRQEWSTLLEELYETGQITFEQKEIYNYLNIVGLVGSIDNDFYGTDLTIGVDTALHRIIENVDAIISTARHNDNIFIVEVMGRHCGYLGLTCALCCEADYLFIPECPPQENWPEKMCEILQITRQRQGNIKLSTHQQNLKLIIVSEGAVDRYGNSITVKQIQKCIADRLGIDAPITVLGHIQRGGESTAFDRIMATRLAACAITTLLKATKDSVSNVISFVGNECIALPLLECVERTQAVAKAMADKNWEVAMKLRGYKFERNYETYLNVTGLLPCIKCNNQQNRLAIVLADKLSPGMNAAIYGFVRTCVKNGDVAIGVRNGFDGLINGDLREMGWMDVDGWVHRSGASLGTGPALTEDKIENVVNRIVEYEINGFVLIGGFDAYLSAILLMQKRKCYPALSIPIIVLPACIDNNVPGTDTSLGSDTCLSAIAEICDRIRQSAYGSKNRLFIVEIMGGYCGYLTLMSAISCGADYAYIFENKFTLKDLKADVERVLVKVKNGIPRVLILSNENASRNYNSDFLRRLFSEEGKAYMTCRRNALGNMQLGGFPSVVDRCFGIESGSKCATWLNQKLNKVEKRCRVKSSDLDLVSVLGVVDKDYKITPIIHLIPETDFEHKVPKYQWWLRLTPLVKVIQWHKLTLRDLCKTEMDEINMRNALAN